MLSELTQTEREYIEKLIAKVGKRRIQPKQCYKNAQLMMFADQEKRLRYWEGQVPFTHAWVTINGKVVDVTLEIARNCSVPFLDYWAGVMISRRMLPRPISSGQEFGPVLPWDDILLETPTPLRETVDLKRVQSMAQRLIRSSSKALRARLVRNSRYRALAALHYVRNIRKGFQVDLQQDDRARIRAVKKDFRVALQEVGDLATLTPEQFKTLQNIVLSS